MTNPLYGRSKPRHLPEGDLGVSDSAFGQDAIGDQPASASLTAEESAHEEARRAIEKEFIQQPRRINASEWNELLLSASPMQRVGRGRTESFKLQEMVFGNISVILCRDEWRFWRLQDHVSLSHDQVLALCRGCQS
jgi:hypothetical protein